MELSPIYLSVFAVCATLVLLIAFQIGSPSLAKDLTDGNSAKRLLRVGQILGVFLIAAAAVRNCVEGESAIQDTIWALSFGILGLVLFAVTGKLGIRLLLQSRLPNEIERGNVAAGVAAGTHYVATAIITSHALAGSDLPSIGLSLVFFGIAQATLHIVISLFRALTTYDDGEQIAGENLAAALSYSGLALAIAIVIARAVEGHFVSWRVSLEGYAGVLAAIVAFYPVRQIFVQTLVLRAPFALRGGKLDHGIAIDRNEGIGTLEAVTYLATALSIARLA